ncbi:MAG: hypothetical protein Q8787_02875, partial [Sweet potato little leaf phytoplasma]|nr:hypothetical protein [Sweet potato little leaf phytoplasma]
MSALSSWQGLLGHATSNMFRMWKTRTRLPFLSRSWEEGDPRWNDKQAGNPSKGLHNNFFKDPLLSHFFLSEVGNYYHCLQKLLLNKSPIIPENFQNI